MDPLDRLVIFLNFVLAAAACLLAIWGVVLGLRAHYRIDAMRRGRGAYSGAPPAPQQKGGQYVMGPQQPRPQPQEQIPAAPPRGQLREEPPTGPIQPATSALESQDAPTRQIRAQRPHLPRPGDL